MFWGLVLEPGKRYSTTVEKSFHVSKAVLDCASARNDSEILSVMLETEGSESLLCNLCKQKGILQENLDLNFMTGDRLTFECRGHGRIHMSGYLLPDDDDDMSGALEDESEEEDTGNSTGWSSPPSTAGSEKKKRKIEDTPSDVPSKKKKDKPNEVEEGDSDDDDDEDDDESGLSEELDDEELDEEEDEDDDDDDDDDSEDEEEVSNLSQKQKQQKQDKNKTPSKQNLNTPKKTPLANGLTPKDQKSNKKTPGEKTPNSTPKQRQVLEQGVVVREIKIGNGMPAKSGKNISVHYVGKLKDSGKVFDKQMKGDGFRFKLGKGEVIKGWDIGVQGMKVGGKRVIHCPPEAAYGPSGVPPKIPPNSTLIFEVELKSVN